MMEERSDSAPRARVFVLALHPEQQCATQIADSATAVCDELVDAHGVQRRDVECCGGCARLVHDIVRHASALREQDLYVAYVAARAVCASVGGLVRWWLVEASGDLLALDAVEDMVASLRCRAFLVLDLHSEGDAAAVEGNGRALRIGAVERRPAAEPRYAALTVVSRRPAGGGDARVPGAAAEDAPDTPPTYARLATRVISAMRQRGELTLYRLVGTLVNERVVPHAAPRPAPQPVLAPQLPNTLVVTRERSAGGLLELNGGWLQGAVAGLYELESKPSVRCVVKTEMLNKGFCGTRIVTTWTHCLAACEHSVSVGERFRLVSTSMPLAVVHVVDWDAHPDIVRDAIDRGDGLEHHGVGVMRCGARLHSDAHAAEFERANAGLLVCVCAQRGPGKWGVPTLELWDGDKRVTSFIDGGALRQAVAAYARAMLLSRLQRRLRREEPCNVLLHLNVLDYALLRTTRVSVAQADAAVADKHEDGGMFTYGRDVLARWTDVVLRNADLLWGSVENRSAYPVFVQVLYVGADFSVQLLDLGGERQGGCSRVDANASVGLYRMGDAAATTPYSITTTVACKDYEGSLLQPTALADGAGRMVRGNDPNRSWVLNDFIVRETLWLVVCSRPFNLAMLQQGELQHLITKSDALGGTHSNAPSAGCFQLCMIEVPIAVCCGHALYRPSLRTPQTPTPCWGVPAYIPVRGCDGESYRIECPASTSALEIIRRALLVAYSKDVSIEEMAAHGVRVRSPRGIDDYDVRSGPIDLQGDEELELYRL